MSTVVTPQSRPGRGVRALFTLAMACTVASVLMGSLVCATDSSAACPNWPGCYVGQIVPRAKLNPVIEFVHRVVAVSCGPLLLACGIVGLRVLRGWRRVLPWVAVAGAVAAGVFGMLTIRYGISTLEAAIDLGCSLIAVVAITWARDSVSTANNLENFQVLPFVTLVVTLGYHVTSVFVAGKGSLTRCLSWPVWRLVPADGAVAPQVCRLVIAAAAGLGIISSGVAASRSRSHSGKGIYLLLGVGVVVILTPLLAVRAPGQPVRAAACVAAAVVWWLLSRLTWVKAVEEG